MKKELLVLIGSLGLQLANGHGHMYNPTPWYATSDCSSPYPGDCSFELRVPSNCTGNNCRSDIGKNAFFTNYTFVPGEATLPEKMYDDWFPEWKRKTWGVGLHPWNAPGSAPVYGNGCGVNGGNPFGCNQADDVFGRCCGAFGGCGGYSGGKPALDHYQDGLFGSPKKTTWTRGKLAEVYSYSNAYHRGGYAYRLCRVQQEEYWNVTEECFQQGHLNFAGKNTWVYWHPVKEYFFPDGWLPLDLVTTRIGTTPPGSEWAKMNLPKVAEPHLDRWAFKNLVEVPDSLIPGEYVLSFRYDCQESPQVWNACANIKIV